MSMFNLFNFLLILSLILSNLVLRSFAFSLLLGTSGVYTQFPTV